MHFYVKIHDLAFSCKNTEASRRRLCIRDHSYITSAKRLDESLSGIRKMSFSTIYADLGMEGGRVGGSVKVPVLT